jgi:hypothetical protein
MRFGYCGVETTPTFVPSGLAPPLGDESLYQMLRTSATLRAMRSSR